MSTTMSIIDCRGLSAPLTVLRIKQAVIGRSDVGLPLDVLVDQSCCDADSVCGCFDGDDMDVRVLYLADVSATADEPRHV